MKIQNKWPASKWATLQATSWKKSFQMTPFCLIFHLGHKKKGDSHLSCTYHRQSRQARNLQWQVNFVGWWWQTELQTSTSEAWQPLWRGGIMQRQNKKCKKKQQPNNSRITTGGFKARSRLRPQQYRAFVKSMAHEYSSPRETTKTPWLNWETNNGTELPVILEPTPSCRNNQREKRKWNSTSKCPTQTEMQTGRQITKRAYTNTTHSSGILTHKMCNVQPSPAPLSWSPSNKVSEQNQWHTYGTAERTVSALRARRRPQQIKKHVSRNKNRPSGKNAQNQITGTQTKLAHPPGGHGIEHVRPND